MDDEREFDCSFPQQEFPRYSVAGYSGIRHIHRRGEEQAQFNTVEYGRLSAVMPVLGGGGVVFRQAGRDRHARYDTPCLPLAPPNTRTPYDAPRLSDTSTPSIGMKYRVLQHVCHLQNNHRSVYVPVRILSSELHAHCQAEDRMEEFDSTLGSMLSFLPYQLPHSPGCLLYSQGPNLQTLTIGLLLEKEEGEEEEEEGEEDSFRLFSLHCSPLRLEALEGQLLPERVQEVHSLRVQGRALVCARSDYRIAFFEAPSRERLLQCCPQRELERTGGVKMGEEDEGVKMGEDGEGSSLLKCLAVFRTDVLTSSVQLCPYIAGEAILVTETGGVYHWSEGGGLIPVQSPLVQAMPTGPTHFWKVCYGPHPRSIILAEHSGVSLGDFRSGSLTFRPLLTQPNEHFPPHSLVTSLSPLPPHPFHFLLTTSEGLVILDSRQPQTPLLAAEHELPDSTRFISTVHTTSDDTVFLLSSCQNSESVVYTYCNGGSTSRASPPYFKSLPHVAASYSDVLTSINHLPLAHYVGYRMDQPVAGSCLAPLSNGRYAAIAISTLGDLFYQCWSYQREVPSPSPPSSLLCTAYHLWMKDAWEQEKVLLRYQDRSTCIGSKEPFLARPLVEYLQSDGPLSLCGHCHAVRKNHFPNSLPLDKDGGREGGKEDGGRCCVCGQTLERYNHILVEARLKRALRKLAREDTRKAGGGGLDALRQSCVIGEPSGGLDRRLWEGWRAEDQPRVKEDSQDEEVKSATPPTTPAQGDKVQRAEVPVRRRKVPAGRPKRRSMGMGFM